MCTNAILLHCDNAEGEAAAAELLRIAEVPDVAQPVQLGEPKQEPATAEAPATAAAQPQAAGDVDTAIHRITVGRTTILFPAHCLRSPPRLRRHTYQTRRSSRSVPRSPCSSSKATRFRERTTRPLWRCAACGSFTAHAALPPGLPPTYLLAALAAYRSCSRLRWRTGRRSRPQPTVSNIRCDMAECGTAQGHTPASSQTGRSASLCCGPALTS